MKILYFFIENFNKISSSDFNLVRLFYLPIIGPNSTILYEYLSSLDQSDSAYKPGVNIDELSKSLAISIEDLNLAKRNLEAVGLIKTFTKNDNKNGLITILKPLTLEKFISNDILKSNLSKRIGDIALEKLILNNKPRPVSKNDYIETSAKYFDMFDFSFEESAKEYVTADLKLPTFSNHDDAVKALTPDQYIRFIDKGAITFGQKEYIGYARNIGLCDQSINTILNYSFECNGRIVVNFIKKITNDLYERNLISFKEISDSLNESIQVRKGKQSNESLD
jgi:replication initiation and membrane attachment protein DnaB